MNIDELLRKEAKEKRELIRAFLENSKAGLDRAEEHILAGIALCEGKEAADELRAASRAKLNKES